MPTPFLALTLTLTLTRTVLHSQYLDRERLKELAAFYAFVLLVALTHYLTLALALTLTIALTLTLALAPAPTLP